MTRSSAGTMGGLQIRVDAVEKDINRLSTQMSEVRDTMATRADMASLFSRIEALSSQYAVNTKPNYALLVSMAGVGLAFLTMIGGFAYWPISTSLSELKQSTRQYVSHKQYEADASVQNAELARLRLELNQTITTTIQQQRYNTDITKFDARLAAAMTKEEFNAVASERAAAVQALTARVHRLEEKLMK